MPLTISEHGILFVGKFQITKSVSPIDTGQFKLHISSSVTFGESCFSQNIQCEIHGLQKVHSIESCFHWKCQVLTTGLPEKPLDCYPF